MKTNDIPTIANSKMGKWIVLRRQALFVLLFCHCFVCSLCLSTKKSRESDILESLGCSSDMATVPSGPPWVSCFFCTKHSWKGKCVCWSAIMVGISESLLWVILELQHSIPRLLRLPTRHGPEGMANRSGHTVKSLSTFLPVRSRPRSL